MKDLEISVQEPKALLSAIRALTVGEIAVLPTDTLYGLHGLATIGGMPDRLAEIKGYEIGSRGFILLVTGVEEIEKWARIEDSERRIIAEKCPGAISLILEARPEAPEEWVTVDEDGLRRIAFRIPDVPFLQELLDLLQGPLLSTSANRAGEAPLESAAEIVKLFGDNVDLVVSDPDLEKRIAEEGATASTLVDLSCRPVKVLREGKVPFESSLKATLG